MSATQEPRADESQETLAGDSLGDSQFSTPEKIAEGAQTAAHEEPLSTPAKISEAPTQQGAGDALSSPVAVTPTPALTPEPTLGVDGPLPERLCDWDFEAWRENAHNT